MQKFFTIVFSVFAFLALSALAGCASPSREVKAPPSANCTEGNLSQQIKPGPEPRQAKKEPATCDHGVQTCCEHEKPMLRHSDKKVAGFLACMQQVLEEGSDSESRQEAAKLLAYGGVSQAKLLIKFARIDEDSEVRQAALRGLEAMGENIFYNSGLPPTNVILLLPWPAEPPKPSMEERQKIQEMVVPALASLARYDDLDYKGTSDIRADAAYALGHFKDRSVIPVLEELALDDESDRVRAFSIWALGSNYLLPKSVTPAMRKAVTDTHSGVRRAVAEALGKMKDPEAVRLLIDMIDKEQDAHNRDWIEMALHYKNDPLLLREYGRAFPKYRKDTQLIILDALETCGWERGELVLPVLQRLLWAEKNTVMKAAIQAAIDDVKESIASREA